MPERCPPSRRDQRNDETNLRSDHDGKMTGPSLVETVSAKRYKILETVGVDNFKAHDLALNQIVTVRRRARPSAGLNL
jgi:hypothetical protein